MAKFQRSNHRALQPIPHVQDNTARMQIRQYVIDQSHHPKRTSDQPSGPGSFAPRGNTNFGIPGTPGH